MKNMGGFSAERRFNSWWRKKTAIDFLPRAVLSEKQWEVFNELKIRFGEKFGIYAGSSISAFLDPMHQSWSSEVRDVIFSDSVLFAITSALVQGEVLLFVADDLYVAGILSEIDIPCLIWKKEDEIGYFVDDIERRLQTCKLDGSRRKRSPTHATEWRVGDGLIFSRRADSLVSSLRRGDDEGWRAEALNRLPKVLREVALIRLLPAAFDEQFPKRAHVAKMNLDVLIHACQPNAPLLAIEVDGKHHENVDQRKKDLTKNEFLLRIGLPLLRIHPAVVKYFNDRDFFREESLRYAAMYFQLASGIAHFERQRQTSFAKLKPLIDRVEEFEESLALANYGKQFAVLIEEELTVITNQTMGSQVFEDLYTAQLESDFERRQSFDQLCLVWPEALSCPRPEVYRNSDGFWTARAKIINRSGLSVDVPFPQIEVVCDHEVDVWDSVLTDALYRYGIEWLAGNAILER